MRNEFVVGLLWHSLTSDNLGVLALTASQIKIIDAAAERAGVTVNYRIFGTVGEKPALELNNRCEIGAPFKPKRILLGQSGFLKQIRECDLIFDIGEGDSFTDIYGGVRFFLQIASKISVLACGRPLILSPQTIGPFEKSWTRWLASMVMSRCRLVYARDHLSKAYLTSLNIVSNSGEAIDVAFRLPYTKNDQVRAEEKIAVGINVSGLMFSGGYTGANQFGLTVDYPVFIRSLLTKLLERGDCAVTLIPHVLTDSIAAEDDYAASLSLAKEFPGIAVAPRFSTPSEAKSYIAGFDFFSGARMHACIAAFSSGVPVVPIAYSRKFIGLFSSVGYDVVGDCREIGNEALLKMVLDGLDNLPALRVRVEEGNRRALERLAGYESFVEQSLAELR